MAKHAAAIEAQVTVNKDSGTVVIGDTRIEIGAKGDVVIFSDELTRGDVQRAAADAAAVAAAGSKQIIVEDSAVSVLGVKVEAADGGLVIHTNSEITLKPAVENVIGQKMEDGSIFAGLTRDGKNEIYAMPKDVRVKGSFNKVAEAIAKLNWNFKHSHNDWQIGSADVVQVVRKNLAEESPLKDTFKESFHADRYNAQRLLSKRAHIALTSTQDPSNPSSVAVVRFTEASSFTVEQRARMKLRTLKRRLQKAFDKKHFYADVRYAKNNLKAGGVTYVSKGSGSYNCRPVRLQAVQKI